MGRPFLIVLGFLATTAFTPAQKDDFAIACSGAIVTKSIDGPRMPYGMVDNRRAICGCMLTSLQSAPGFEAQAKKRAIAFFRRVAANLPPRRRDRTKSWQSARKLLTNVGEQCGAKFARPAPFPVEARMALQSTCTAAILKAKDQGQQVPDYVIAKNGEICGCIAKKVAEERFLDASQKREAHRIFEILVVGDRDQRRTLRQKLRSAWGKRNYLSIRNMLPSCMRKFHKAARP